LTYISASAYTTTLLPFLFHILFSTGGAYGK
jgi:hypothetical protein